MKRLVLIGGGHAHVLVLKGLGARPILDTHLTLVARDVLTPYSGMLPGYVAGHYTYAECHIDLAPLARFAGATLIHDEAIGVQRGGKTIDLASGAKVPYDFLSIDIGSRPRQHDVPGSVEHAVPVKPIDRFVTRWDAMVARVMATDAPRTIGVIGGGAGGVELLLAVRHKLLRLGRRGLHFVVVTSSGLLMTHNRSVQARFARILAERGVEVHDQSEVIEVVPGAVRRRSGASIAIDEILWVTDASTAPWLAGSGFACDARGFVRVSTTLQTISDPAVFAAGDCASMDEHPRPKAGVFAVRQGPPLEANLRAVLAGQAPQPFIPQSRFLSLVSTGDKYAVASRGTWAAEGRWLWTYKDHIDRKFMRRFESLPTPARA